MSFGHRQEDLKAAASRANVVLLTVCGWLGIGGAIAAILSDIIGSVVVPNYDWMSDTISDLAAGRYSIIQDVGLYAFAGSLLACAIGTANFHSGQNSWTAGVLSLALMAAIVTVIGARNEYGDRDATTTWGVHLGLVYFLMSLFLATALLMAPGMTRVRAGYRMWSLICSALFVVTAMAYFFSPSAFVGLTERAVALVAIGWVVTVSRMLLDVRSEVEGWRPASAA
jgi:Protein of unknown function (DUF998)